MPNLVAYDLAGVQPMSGPTGLIFAMRSRYSSMTGTETFYNEVDSAFSGRDKASNAETGFVDGDAGMGTTSVSATNPAVLNPVSSASSLGYTVGMGMRTDNAEALDGTGNDCLLYTSPSPRD